MSSLKRPPTFTFTRFGTKSYNIIIIKPGAAASSRTPGDCPTAFSPICHKDAWSRCGKSPSETPGARSRGRAGRPRRCLSHHGPRRAHPVPTKQHRPHQINDLDTTTVSAPLCPSFLLLHVRLSRPSCRGWPFVSEPWAWAGLRGPEPCISLLGLESLPSPAVVYPLLHERRASRTLLSLPHACLPALRYATAVTAQPRPRLRLAATRLRRAHLASHWRRLVTARIRANFSLPFSILSPARPNTRAAQPSLSPARQADALTYTRPGCRSSRRGTQRRRRSHAANRAQRILLQLPSPCSPPLVTYAVGQHGLGTAA